MSYGVGKLIVKKDDIFPLVFQEEKGRTDLFVRATVFTAGFVQLYQVTLPHTQNGIYSRIDTFATDAGNFWIKTEVFRDAAFTKKLRYRDKIVNVFVDDGTATLSGDLTAIRDTIIETIDAGDGQAV